MHRRPWPRLPPVCARRAQRYDEIVDSLGLIRSAVIARIARGRRHGYDSRSIREPLASAFYDVRYGISRDLHSVERMRILYRLRAWVCA